MSLNLATILREGAKQQPEKIAIRESQTTLTYRELDLLARRTASGLSERGIRRGQHVAVLLPNVSAFPIVYFGALYAGTPLVTLNPLLTPSEIAFHLQNADAVALITEKNRKENAARAAKDAPQCQHVLTQETLLADEPVEELADTMPDDTAVILYTSGTTGRPKGAELTHFNLLKNAEIAPRQAPPGFNMAEAVSLAALPFFHSFGQTVVLNSTLLFGGSVVLLPRFSAGEAMRLIDEHRVNFFGGVPTMYFEMLHHDQSDRYSLSSLERCISGGAPLPVEVMRAFDAKYGVDIKEGYGLSETSPVACFNPQDRPKKPGSIGVPPWGVELRIVGAEDEVINEPRICGELCIKGHNIMKGYYRHSEATASAIQDGWFHTGDMAICDEDGFYFIVDRKKDMILRGGFNVYPREVEEVLYSHDAVKEAAVIGVPDERLGEEVKAYVALEQGSTVSEAELIEHCKEHLAAYKYPRQITFLDELPKGSTGKFLKRLLRSQ